MKRLELNKFDGGTACVERNLEGRVKGREREKKEGRDGRKKSERRRE